MSVRPLSAALRKKAEEEVNEIPSRMVSDLKVLRDWFKQQPHLHSIELNDQWLIAFLRGSKYNIEKCKGKLEMYYTLKTTVPEFYGNRDPFDPDIQEIIKLGFFLPLKKCVQEDSPRTALVRVEPFSRSHFALANLIKVALMIAEIMMLEDDNFTIAGEDVIVDTEHLSIGLLWQWTPAMAKKATSCSEKALSVRLKSMHIFNAHVGLKAAIVIFKMFLGAKLRDRIHVYDKRYKNIYKSIDKSILPVEYGGTDGTLQELTEYWKAKIESYRDWFVQSGASSDESKRPRNDNNSNDPSISFRKLELD